MDGIRLTFEEDAFRAIARLAIERQTGARGLRSILEGIMMRPMFELPSEKDVKEVVVTRAFVEGKEPLHILRSEKEDEVKTAEEDENKAAE